MADKGIVVEEANSGESIGCVDLRKPDDDANNRIVQLVSDVPVSSGLQNWYNGTPLRLLVFGSSDAKSPIPASQGDHEDDLYNLDTEITDNLIDVRDASAVMFFGTFLVDGDDVDAVNGVSIKVTPLIFPDSGIIPASVLAQSEIRWNNKTALAVPTVAGVYAGDNDGTGYLNSQAMQTYISDSSYNVCPFNPMVWPTYGAYSMGFHIRASQAIVGVLRIFAATLTGNVANSALVDQHNRSKQLSSAFFKSYN